jgi:hypothetical protein
VIKGIEFSAGGDPPTDFEIRLLQASQAESPWVLVGQRLMLELGPRVGATALALVLDELGTEKIYVTPRRNFFERLWGVERDAKICALALRNEWSYGEIAQMFKVSKQYVFQLVTGKSSRRTDKTRRS